MRCWSSTAWCGRWAIKPARRQRDADEVDLDGGFLMPSFGDGHAHPLYGGLEYAGTPGAAM